MTNKSAVPMGDWDFYRKEGRIGTGDWSRFPADRFGDIEQAATEWKRQLTGIARPWLCWCIEPEWCYVQQQLVAAVGWTPVVGTDGRHPSPPLIPGAVFVDFNAQLQLPGMWMHFPLEFVFLFTDRLAFWHSDVLPPLDAMKGLAAQFERIHPDELIATRKDIGFFYMVRRILRGKRIRGVAGWTEIAGCVSAGASRSQFEHGCGWWRGLAQHPHASPRVVALNPHWEHGVGIRHWERLFGGRVTPLAVDIAPYHYSRAGRAGHRYRRALEGRTQVGSKVSELTENFDLAAIVAELGLPVVLPGDLSGATSHP